VAVSHGDCRLTERGRAGAEERSYRKQESSCNRNRGAAHGGGAPLRGRRFGSPGAQETELGGKLRSGDQVVVPAGETIEGDLYASGGLVRVEGRVEGDLLAAAGQQVAGQVTGDVMAAGGSIDVSGRVGGDVRAAGGSSPSADP
jgi:hypothetical protein